MLKGPFGALKIQGRFAPRLMAGSPASPSMTELGKTVGHSSTYTNEGFIGQTICTPVDIDKKSCHDGPILTGCRRDRRCIVVRTELCEGR